jgi:hypothetical protein
LDRKYDDPRDMFTNRYNWKGKPVYCATTGERGGRVSFVAVSCAWHPTDTPIGEAGTGRMYVLGFVGQFRKQLDAIGKIDAMRVSHAAVAATSESVDDAESRRKRHSILAIMAAIADPTARTACPTRDTEVAARLLALRRPHWIRELIAVRDALQEENIVLLPNNRPSVLLNDSQSGVVNRMKYNIEAIQGPPGMWTALRRGSGDRWWHLGTGKSTTIFHLVRTHILPDSVTVVVCERNKVSRDCRLASRSPPSS